MAVGVELVAAGAAIKNDDWHVALEHLLTAWREVRDPRIAALVDRVSEHLPSTPVPGKTVKLRIEKWLEIAKNNDAADVGALLATPWPGKWEDGATVMKALVERPVDPRVAMAVATYIAGYPFDSNPSSTFYSWAADLLWKIGDPRTKLALEGPLKRVRPAVYETATKDLAEPPALTDGEEASLASVESMFASEVHTEKAQERTEDDFLREIVASRDDDGPRAVFADWLTERGNPRGEFITLQLAPETEATKKRINALLKKHGREWAGALDHVVDKNARVFSRGFLSGVNVLDGVTTDLPNNFGHAEWALVERLVMNSVREGTYAPFFAASWLRTLKALTSVYSESLVAHVVTRNLAPNLEEIEFQLAREDSPNEETVLGRHEMATKLPKLKKVAVGGNIERVKAFIDGPFPPRLERFGIFHALHPLAELARLVVSAKRNIDIVEARAKPTENDANWTFELSRDAEHRFTKLRARATSSAEPLPTSTELLRVLGTLPELTELVVERGAGCKWSQETLVTVEEAIAKLDQLRVIEVPWDRDVDRKTDEGVGRLHIDVHLSLPTLEALDGVWTALKSPAVSVDFDSMAVNNKGHQVVEGDVLARVKKELAKKNTKVVEVYRKRGATTHLALRPTRFSLFLPRPPSFDLDAWLEWLVAFLDRVEVNEVEGSFLVPQYRTVSPLEAPLRWLWSFGAKQTHFAFEDLEVLAVAVEGVRLVKSKHHRILLLTPSQDVAPSQELVVSFERELVVAFWKNYRRKHGFLPDELALEILPPILAKRGFEEQEGYRWHGGRWQRADGARVILRKEVSKTGYVSLTFELRRPDNRPHWPVGILLGDKPTKEGMTAKLVAVEKELEWLDGTD